MCDVKGTLVTSSGDSMVCECDVNGTLVNSSSDSMVCECVSVMSKVHWSPLVVILWYVSV